MAAAQESRLDDSTTIPLGWLVAAIGACITCFMVISGMIIWATRLEARADQQQEKITKLELQQEQYRSDQEGIQKALVRIEVLLERK